VAQIRWTEEAVRALEALNVRDLDALFERLELVEQFPTMYPQRQRGRFAGLRYLVISKRWLVYYRVASAEAVVIFDVVPALGRS